MSFWTFLGSFSSSFLAYCLIDCFAFFLVFVHISFVFCFLPSLPLVGSQSARGIASEVSWFLGIWGELRSVIA
jgi:hypothetical protein